MKQNSTHQNNIHIHEFEGTYTQTNYFLQKVSISYRQFPTTGFLLQHTILIGSAHTNIVVSKSMNAGTNKLHTINKMKQRTIRAEFK